MATTARDKSGAGTPPETNPGNDAPAEELGTMIDDMLNDLSGKFTAIASELTAKMDDMGRRIDNLEASMQQGQRGKEGEERSP